MEIQSNSYRKEVKKVRQEGKLSGNHEVYWVAIRWQVKGNGWQKVQVGNTGLGTNRYQKIPECGLEGLGDSQTSKFIPALSLSKIQ